MTNVVLKFKFSLTQIIFLRLILRSPSFTYSIIKTLIYLNHHQQNHNWHLWILSSNSTLSPFTIITFFPSRASTKPTLTKTKGKQSFLEVARSFENPPSTGFNAKFAQGKKKRKKERSATRIVTARTLFS